MLSSANVPCDLITSPLGSWNLLLAQKSEPQSLHEGISFYVDQLIFHPMRASCALAKDNLYPVSYQGEDRSSQSQIPHQMFLSSLLDVKQRNLICLFKGCKNKQPVPCTS